MIIRQLFPDAKVETRRLAGSVVLSGTVTEPQHVSRITELAEGFFADVVCNLNVRDTHAKADLGPARPRAAARP